MDSRCIAQSLKKGLSIRPGLWSVSENSRPESVSTRHRIVDRTRRSLAAQGLKNVIGGGALDLTTRAGDGRAQVRCEQSAIGQTQKPLANFARTIAPRPVFHLERVGCVTCEAPAFQCVGDGFLVYYRTAAHVNQIGVALHEAQSFAAQQMECAGCQRQKRQHEIARRQHGLKRR